MAGPNLEQSAANTIARYQSRSCTATFTRATTTGNLVTIICSSAGPNSGATLTAPAGFTLAGTKAIAGVQLTAWYRQASPSVQSVTITAPDDRSMQVRCFEHSGVAQANALDQIVISADESYQAGAASTSVTSQPDSLVLAFTTNQYASCTQYGYIGGLVRLFDSLSPQTWGYYQSNQDYERHRLTCHQASSSSAAYWQLYALLSSIRKWICFILIFRGGSSGPARFTSTRKPSVICGGTGSLTVFGPLVSGKSLTSMATPMIRCGNQQARVGPFNYQYRLGGWSGLLIGDDTPYEVEEEDGLEGWDLRTSDDNLPRGDGALRGVDLQSSRQIMFTIKTGSTAGSALGIQSEVETNMDYLYRALVPQRDADWELIWRHPGRPLRMVRVRPTNLLRGLDWEQTQINSQKFVLIASDPRHYSAFSRTAKVPPNVNGQPVIPTTVINDGNGFAYPLIRITGPTSGPAITRVELINSTLDISFAVEAALPGGSTLIGDMEARATGAARSVVTIDTQSKYGAWAHPRETFVLGPGANSLQVVTVPAGAPITCSLDYRDTWSG